MLLSLLTGSGNSVELSLSYFSGLYVTQSGVTATIDVTLKKPENCTISVTSANSYVSIDDTDLVFTTGNYDTPQTITLTYLGGFNGATVERIIFNKGSIKYGESEVWVADNNIPANLYSVDPYDDFHDTTLAGLNAMRTQAIEWIWGVGASLPTGDPTNWGAFTGDTYLGLTNLTNLSTATRGEVAHSGNWKLYVYRLTPNTSNSKCIIFSFGHYDDWATAGGSGGGNYDSVFNYFLGQGYEILTFYTVGRGPNPTDDGITQGQGGVGGTHDQMATLESSDPYFNPFEYFLTTGIKCVNYAITLGFTDIYATGHSAGCWGSIWLSALDTRIKGGYGVCGGAPTYIKLAKKITSSDYEQGHNDPGDVVRSTPFVVSQYENQTSYSDLFCMATQGGEFYILDNTNDPVGDGYLDNYSNTVYKIPVQRKAVNKFDTYNFVGSIQHYYMDAIAVQVNTLINS